MSNTLGSIQPTSKKPSSKRTAAENRAAIIDPILFAKTFWPHVCFYREQRQLIYSVVDNYETDCIAGNMLGKDFVSAFIVLWFFLSRNPCRIMTTSVDNTQLESVLWGEIKNFIDTSTHAEAPDRTGILNYTEGGPLLVNHLHIRKVLQPGTKEERICAYSYIKGKVAAKPESMLGHHVRNVGDGVPRTLILGDEASGIDDGAWAVSDSWAERKLAIGNPYPTTNFFYRAYKEGDLKSKTPNVQFYRKVIKIKAEDSPNVRLAMEELKCGRTPSNDLVVPGVLSYQHYVQRRETWDAVKQMIGLDAQFYEGAEVLLCPPQWLDNANRRAAEIASKQGRVAKAIGIDPAEGSDKTAFCAVDEWGILELVSKKTPDTSIIEGEILAFLRRHRVAPESVCIDQGGGGKQIADRLRSIHRLPVRTIPFGEPVQQAIEERKRRPKRSEQVDVKEERYVYKNRRAQMYGELRERLDPSTNEFVFAIPIQYANLRSELAPIPMLYDSEGRMYLPPKKKKSETSKEKSLIEIIGHSPDEADALVLAIHGLGHKVKRVIVGGYR